MNKNKKSFLLTILGASGDLAKLKIFPSLFDLARRGLLETEYGIIGYARSEKTQEVFRNEFAEAVRKAQKESWSENDEKVLRTLLEKVFYHQGLYDDATSYNLLAEQKQEIMGGDYVRDIFMFSVPPSVFEGAIKAIDEAEKIDNKKVNLVIEKPFGENTKTAEHLFYVMGDRFEEKQIYLLDHYLGKHSIRSLIPLRHNNRLLSNTMKGTEIDNIQITVTEPFGVEQRLGYFDKVGIIRDMIQSHMLQVLGLVAMSIPIEKNAEAIRNEKTALLSSLSFVPKKTHVSIGQYEGFCDDGICDMFTPTFCALRLQINREDWYEVPIVLKTGKCIGERKESYVAVELKKFKFQEDDFPANKIVFEFAPEEKLHMKLYNENGAEVHTHQDLNCDKCSLPEHAQLLLDVLEENQMYFVSFKEIIACWKVIDDVIALTENQRPEIYKVGTNGPKTQDDVFGACKITEHKL